MYDLVREVCVSIQMFVPIVVVSLSWSLPSPASELLSDTLSSYIDHKKING